MPKFGPFSNPVRRTPFGDLRSTYRREGEYPYEYPIQLSYEVSRNLYKCPYCHKPCRLLGHEQCIQDSNYY